MFAVKITLNDEGKSLLFESIQSHIDSIPDLPKLLKERNIKDKYIKCIEIIESSCWDGYKY